MKNISLSLSSFLFLAAILLLASCGEKKGHFKLEGRFLHLNQGEFYVYSPDGVIDGMDTVKIEGGRFTYEIPCKSDAGTLMLVFPNFSQQPVFVGSGESVEISADASHLKEMEVKGTDENELMTDFRKQISSASPAEERKYAAQFINDNPESYVCTYLLKNYFTDYKYASTSETLHLINIVEANQPKNGYVVQLKKAVSDLSKLGMGKALPKFSGVDTNGKTISNYLLDNAKVAVVCVWSTWNFDSQNIQRQLKNYYRKSGGELQILSICIDASKKECSNSLQRDSIRWSNVCDGNMFEGKIVKTLGITTVPDVILIQNGKIVAHGLRVDELKNKLDKILH